MKTRHHNRQQRLSLTFCTRNDKVPKTGHFESLAFQGDKEIKMLFLNRSNKGEEFVKYMDEYTERWKQPDCYLYTNDYFKFELHKVSQYLF